MNETTKKPRRLRIILWASSASLTVGVVLVLVLAVWLPYSKRQAVVDEIESYSARVGTDNSAPEYFRGLFGADKVRGFEQVTSVTFMQGHGDDRALPRIGQLAQLDLLDLRGTGVTDLGLSRLRGLTKLRSLVLAETAVTDDGVAQLAKIVSLESLDLTSVPVTDESFKSLAALPRLRQLVLSGTHVSQEGLAAFRATHPDITIVVDPVTEQGWGRLRNQMEADEEGRIVGLSFNGRRSERLTDADVEHMLRLTDLKDLYVHHCAIEERLLRAMAQLPALERLSLIDVPITGSELRALGDLQALKSINILGVSVGDAGFEALTRISALEDLGLSGAKGISDGAMMHLSRLPHLKRFSPPLTLSDEGMQHLAPLTELEFLDLDTRRITDTGLVHLKDMARLQTLDLSHTKVTDKGLKHLEHLRELTYLRFYSTRATAEGVETLKRELPNLKVGTK
ncbi:MAG: hypothetical protein CMJ48_07415 [Planctomycetaceae bacterium]|nr:hypothetical protein [Planctomycetaceae bacterium]